MEELYNYNDGAYKHLSLHRRVTSYDPRNTDNLIVLDYFNTQRRNKNTTTIYTHPIEIAKFTAELDEEHTTALRQEQAGRLQATV